MIKYYKTKGEWEDSWQCLHVYDANRMGYIEYFGPCAIHSEGYMIQNVIKDILLNGRDKYCVVKYPGNLVEIWIIPNYNQGHPHPYIKMTEEEEE